MKSEVHMRRKKRMGQRERVSYGLCRRHRAKFDIILEAAGTLAGKDEWAVARKEQIARANWTECVSRAFCTLAWSIRTIRFRCYPRGVRHSLALACSRYTRTVRPTLFLHPRSPWCCFRERSARKINFTFYRRDILQFLPTRTIPCSVNCVNAKARAEYERFRIFELIKRI